MKGYPQYAVVLLAAYVLFCPVAYSRSRAAAVDEWREVSMKGRFSFSLPSSMERVVYDISIGETDGVRAWFSTPNADAVRAEYRDSRMYLGLDYGRLAEGFSGYENELEIKEEAAEISGEAAKIITFRSRGTVEGHHYFAAMYFVSRSGGGRGRPPLFMWVSGEGAADQEKAKKIFHSIKLLPPA